MSSGLASDEVAEDYKNSLEDLTTNDRFQISNLTVIAKENTEHAMAISRVLENHIRTTPPAQKLPALYVVDSIVKNVGTPYTLFLGRNMYQTFMNAYTLVDSQTRRKLDEMLKTWKEPVPGSLDTRPVFPPEITRGIESALIKARTAALQQQQARSQQEILTRGRNGTPQGWSSTPTPSQNMNRYPPVSSQTVPVHYQRNGAGHAYTSSGETIAARATPPAPTQQRTEIDLSVLNRDIESLIAAARSDFANNPLDPSVQQRLKALLDLQGILQRHELTQEQLRLVRDQVSALAPKPAIPASQAQNIPAVSTPPVAATPPIQTHSQPLQQLLNPGMLAGLIKATAARQQPTPPSLLAGLLPQIPVMNSTHQPPVPVAPENPLIAALRAQGLLPPASAPPASSTVPPSNITSAFPLIVPGQVRFTPPVPTPQTQGSTDGQVEVQMNTASIKIPRYALIATLYDLRSNRCGTCGRRFFATEEGKERKARHLDWHFRTNQRMSDAAKRAQNRSWYVDERDWIKSREAGDDQDSADAEASGDSAGGHDGNVAKKEPSKPWIRAPNDATLRNTPCPICQEKFESTWSEEVQDWIWQDATNVGSRVYHASCYAEVTKEGPTSANRGVPLARTGTPDSVLGKRKAEITNSPGPSVRVKTEPI
ncbi:putative mRNA cleavage factor complex component Pcf11 [Aspergillus saccharolyticus JOP 1030-1]|uniref:Putative mRNA cleavage factor complex component Pcf11 n=1 Tax=Aspergillus saccharolyticus JOP 1030-1 TaxID=1450539 RepID=A0A318Z5K9_9EURO|nr:putative mRNA cleavage factor complex component Pcf11 [Aspergillus saccharolyticus JOP 1030-1]PYH42585.1 putative mRNA cleavage factor complex component Pcf11 [Aspergillus saccharolyticus JOP 1030-1]